MALTTAFTEMFGVRHPIALAPMGGFTGGALTAAVSNGGGLGLLGAGYGDAAWLARESAIAAEHTREPWGIGFLTWAIDIGAVERALALGPRAVMLAFGDPRPFAGLVRESGAALIMQVTDLAEARQAIDLGADVIVAQGTEAGGQHRRGRHKVGHDRDERQRRSPPGTAVPTGLDPLCHDDIRANVQRPPGLIEVGDLHDQRRPGLPDGFEERCGVAEGQHDHPWPVGQREFHQADVGRPALEADTPGIGGTVGGDRQFAGQPVPVPPAGAEHAQAAAVGNRRRQGTPGGEAHRRQRDRVPHCEVFRERCTQRHDCYHPRSPGPQV